MDGASAEREREQHRCGNSLPECEKLGLFCFWQLPEYFSLALFFFSFSISGVVNSARSCEGGCAVSGERQSWFCSRQVCKNVTAVPCVGNTFPTRKRPLGKDPGFAHMNDMFYTLE